MKCCTNCFRAKEIIAFIEATGTEGDCNFCGTEEVKTMPAEDLGQHFDPLMELYEEADTQKYHEDESLADLISGWKVFSDKLEIEKQNEILDEIRLGPKDPKDRSISRKSCERWQYKYAYWEEDIWERFSEYIKHSRRFILERNSSFFFADPREWLPGILSATELTFDPSRAFFRARQGCSDKSFRHAPIPASDMGPPPGEIARRGGRANPAGISYLYVAEEQETAVAEIRPYVGALVSVCSMKAKKPLKVADITQIHGIENVFSHSDLKAQVQRNGLLNVLNRELARPVKPDDSEIEYVPTQYLAEAILEIGYDGIRYRSAVRNGGTNFVFFEPKNLSVEGESWLVEVKSIEVKFDRIQ